MTTDELKKATASVRLAEFDEALSKCVRDFLSGDKSTGMTIHFAAPISIIRVNLRISPEGVDPIDQSAT